MQTRVSLLETERLFFGCFITNKNFTTRSLACLTSCRPVLCCAIFGR